MNTRNKQIYLLLFSVSVLGVESAVLVKNNSPTTTILTTRDVSEPKATIDVKIIDKPHHLFIGRCNPKHDILHGENIILNNDGKSHVNATIQFNIESAVNITCVKVIDKVPDGEGGYPHYVEGGVGHNYVVIAVTTNYGKGFNFYVQIYGVPLTKEAAALSPSERITIVQGNKKKYIRKN